MIFVETTWTDLFSEVKGCENDVKHLEIASLRRCKFVFVEVLSTALNGSDLRVPLDNMSDLDQVQTCFSSSSNV